MILLTVNPYDSVMIFDYAVGRGQAEAGPFPHVLGGKKRLKNSFDDIRVDAHTGIGYRYFYIISLRNFEGSAVFIT